MFITYEESFTAMIFFVFLLMAFLITASLIYRNGHWILLGDAAELHKHRDCKIWPCGTKFILFYSSYLAHKCTSFYIKITTYYLPFKFESQNEDRLSNFEKIFIFVLSNGVFPMLLTENTTNDTCQSNLRGAWK